MASRSGSKVPTSSASGISSTATGRIPILQRCSLIPRAQQSTASGAPRCSWRPGPGARLRRTDAPGLLSGEADWRTLFIPRAWAVIQAGSARRRCSSRPCPSAIPPADGRLGRGRRQHKLADFLAEGGARHASRCPTSVRQLACEVGRRAGGVWRESRGTIPTMYWSIAPVAGAYFCSCSRWG
jgi:hypothetical protein